MNYKDTLLMPKTDFEMRGNLPKKEPKYVERWQENDMYNKVIQQNEGKDSFVFHDGPPYANGNMHMGHMLNKVIKDVICRYKNMNGFYTPYIPGWDTHGLPIENAIQKLGVNRKEMPTAKFREKCDAYAHEQVNKQMAQLIRMGTFADYKHPYLTLQHEFEARQIEVFAKMAMDGLIFKGLKPVYWSPSSESALAEAEVEYHDIKSPTIFVKFQVKDGKGVLDNDVNFVIWTTTPWTIPANLAICLNASYNYALVETEKGKLIVLDTLVDELMAKFEITDYKVVNHYKGSELEYITCQHPLYDRESLVILGDHVTADSGTGCVHTAPGFGADDFFVGQKYNLPAYCNVDEHGCMMEDCGEWLAGQYVDDANKTVTMKLDEIGALLKLEFITHSYPHDWRTKKPIIFRATDQWFCSLDKIRDKLLSEIDNVNWLNEWGHIRIYNMIRDRGDWCISRQRTWGVPIPIFYCEDGTPIIEQEVFDHISKLFREHGSNVWFERDEKDLLPEGYTNEHSPNGIFKKEKDIMDVWFDSGSSHTGVMVERGFNYPVDLYFEGSDQYRGWFNSSLIIGVAAHGKAPYKTVLSHGFVLDGKGNKMSKSLGNTVDPIKLVNQYGADIVRLWATSVAYQQDVRISDEIMKQVAEGYRKIRNTMRFVLGNLNDFKASDLVEIKDLPGVDQYMLAKLNELMKAYDEAYEKAVELQKSEGYTFVHPFDDEDVMEGQGTIALEIMEELPDVDYILVPIGGGGFSSYCDIIAMRHPKEGAPLVATRRSKVPLINAGDGGHNHPTQTLTDLMTIRELRGSLDNFTIGLCGDLKFGRTVHSLTKAMSRYKNIKFVFIAPPELKIPEYLKHDLLDAKNLDYKEAETIEEVIEDLDILYMTRVQKERFFNEQDYIRLKDTYILDLKKLEKSKSDLIVMHPLPRVNEITTEVDDDPRAKYFDQVQNGRFMRMALILKMLGLENEVER